MLFFAPEIVEKCHRDASFFYALIHHHYPTMNVIKTLSNSRSSQQIGDFLHQELAANQQLTSFFDSIGPKSPPAADFLENLFWNHPSLAQHTAICKTLINFTKQLYDANSDKLPYRLSFQVWLPYSSSKTISQIISHRDSLRRLSSDIDNQLFQLLQRNPGQAIFFIDQLQPLASDTRMKWMKKLPDQHVQEYFALEVQNCTETKEAQKVHYLEHPAQLPHWSHVVNKINRILITPEISKKLTAEQIRYLYDYTPGLITPQHNLSELSQEQLEQLAKQDFQFVNVIYERIKS